MIFSNLEYYRPSLGWSVNGVMFAPQTKTSDVCKAHLPMMLGSILSFKTQLRRSLSIISMRAGCMAIMLSGGADSEMIAREMKDEGLPFELHFIRFQDGSNQEDYVQAVALAEQLGHRLHVHSHNIQAFLNSKLHIQGGLDYGTSDLSLITVYHYAKNLGLPVILGPEILLQKHQRPGGVSSAEDWYVILGEHSSSAERFMQRHGVPMIGELHFMNTSLMISALRLPRVASLVENTEPGRISLAYIKNAILEKALGYSFIATKKRHGYEPVYPTFRNAVNEIKNALPYIPFELRIPYFDILENVYEHHLSYPQR